MSTDDYGTEYIYPPAKWGESLSIQSERICAQDERFASVNEALGLLDYKLEQHITQCADGLAPLADFISSSWAVIDELEARIAKLEEAQPKPVPDNYAHIPAAEWEAIVEELEWLRNQRAVMDADGVLLSHDAWDAVERELHELQAFKAGVPWAAMMTDFRPTIETTPKELQTAVSTVLSWFDANAPKEAGEC